MGLTGTPERPSASQEPIEFIIREVIQQSPEPTSSFSGNAIDEPSASFGECDSNDAPVIRIAMPFDQATLLHPIHDPGSTRL